MTDNAKVDVAAVINDSEISRFQYLIFTICVMIMMCDGFDTQALAYVAPSIASEWKLSPGVFGPIFAAVLLGSMVGAFTFGYLADRFGRKRTLVLCMIVFGALNIGSAYAASIESFTLLRFLCGIGLGGAIPNVMALASEYAPARKRATSVAIAWCGFSLGAVLGGLISVPLISHFGWKSVFIFGGILPLCLVPIVVFALPESIKFLILVRGKSAEVISVLRKIAPGRHFDDSSAFVLDEPRPGRGSLSALFRDGLAIGSVFLCLAFFMSLMLVYLFINWIPLLLREAGLPLQDALMGTIIFNLSGIAGSLVCTQLIDRKIVRAPFTGRLGIRAVNLGQYLNPGTTLTVLEAIDTVYVDFKDSEGLRATTRAARRDGFTGRLAIHPDQVPVINEAFTPTDAERAHAQRVVDAFSTSTGAGAVSLDGKMFDIPHLRAARRVLGV